jgi:hypothetical protein
MPQIQIGSMAHLGRKSIRRKMGVRSGERQGGVIYYFPMKCNPIYSRRMEYYVARRLDFGVGWEVQGIDFYSIECGTGDDFHVLLPLF